MKEDCSDASLGSPFSYGVIRTAASERTERTMRSIQAGNKNILGLLGRAVRDGATYRPSAYLLRRETEDGLLLCNTLTGELALLSDGERKAFEDLPGRIPPVLADAAKHRLIVPESCDEYAAAEQVRAILNRRRGKGGVVDHYNILTTTHCNARCFYCYESGMRKVHMTDGTADALAEHIARHRGEGPVRLSWFGGEPLLGARAADRICSALLEKGVDFTSDMVSNAYLFDEALVRHAAEHWRLKKIQVTLDGTEEVYDRTKAYVGIGGSAYRRVLRNIRLLLDGGIRVNVRLNMDTHNAEDLRELIRELASLFGGEKDLYVYVRVLDADVGYDPIRHGREDKKRLEDRCSALRDLLEENGWPQARANGLPCLAVISCMADDPRTLQCTPDGILGKCEDRIYGHTVGTLERGITDTEETAYWRERTVTDGCRTCPIFPSCRDLLKNCPTRPRECPGDDKDRRIRAYGETMLRVYEAYKNGVAETAGSGEGPDGREERL